MRYDGDDDDDDDAVGNVNYLTQITILPYSRDCARSEHVF